MLATKQQKVMYWNQIKIYLKENPSHYYSSSAKSMNWATRVLKSEEIWTIQILPLSSDLSLVMPDFLIVSQENYFMAK